MGAVGAQAGDRGSEKRGRAGGSSLPPPGVGVLRGLYMICKAHRARTAVRQGCRAGCSFVAVVRTGAATCKLTNESTVDAAAAAALTATTTHEPGLNW